MASISKTAKGYRAQVFVLGVRKSASFRTKREADAWASATETEIREAAALSPGIRHTLRDAMRKYGEEVSPSKRGSRAEQIRLKAFSADPFLPCDKPMASITPDDFSSWREARLKVVSPSSVLRDLNILSALFETARREWRWVETNPISDVRKPQRPDHREVVITRQQIAAMLREMRYPPSGDIRSVSQAVAVCFLVALRTGMRASELCGLTWDRVFDGYCSTPHKTGRTVDSLRHVPLTAKARRLIERMRGYDDLLVFGVSSRSLDALFRKYRQRAGLEGFTFHDARHTAATWIVKNTSIDVLSLCKAFGWSNPRMAMTYFNPTATDLTKMLETKRR